MTQGSWRVGVSVAKGSPLSYDLTALGVGWIMNWRAYSAPPVPPGVQFAQTVRMRDGHLAFDGATLSAIAAANPGALWLISNEPDVKWQDNVTPEVYARLYHEAYRAIKAGDPGATVAAGGIAQPTPLRLRYLDRVLESYVAQFGEPLPAQAWHIHNYMLREERDSWGVDIPPGFTDNQGVLYSVDDSGNIERFKQQLYEFRGWMSSRGYGGLSLIVSEFGIPMPADYGFPPERVANFLRETTHFMNTAEGGGLVQRWCWFSLADPYYATGNLVDLETGEWTSLGRTWMEIVGQ
ncbi:MAG: glycosyl hydrolase [Anaerolineae bacterium]